VVGISDQEFDREVQRHYRHNFLVNVLDGTFFWCGASLIAPRTILSVYVSRLTSSDLLIGLLATIASTGWFLPQLLTANWVQRLPRKRVLPVNLGLLTERLPVLLLAPAALLAYRYPVLALTALFVLMTWHSVGAGVVAVAWQDMVGKIIPASRRGSFFGLTNFLGTATGVLGAGAAAWLLDHDQFPMGYVWCFALAAVLISTSWVFLAQTREPARQSDEPPVSQREYWRRLPSVLRADPNFVRFLLSWVITAFGGMAAAFLAVYAVQRWHLPDGQAGIFTASTLVGQALANLAFGSLSDRHGHKVVLEASTLIGALGVGLAMLAPGPAWFYLVFALLGANYAGYMLSGLMIALEFCGPELRPTYIGLNNTVRGAANGVAPIVGGWLAGALGYQALFAASVAAGLLGLALLHWGVREPRQALAAASSPGTRRAAGRRVPEESGSGENGP
jgi:MFS family permease